MKLIKANHNNLASVLMGKNIWFPWRGQRDVVISVSYDDWFDFIVEFNTYFKYRTDMAYSEAVSEKGSLSSYKYFCNDISWALYNELCISANMQEDATLILPYFDDGEDKNIESVINFVNSYQGAFKSLKNLEAWTGVYNSIISGNQSYDGPKAFGKLGDIDLSDWNCIVCKLCVYLQSLVRLQDVESMKVNIDWRSL